jgi:cell wall-associated NlpC family hydrolase
VRVPVAAATLLRTALIVISAALAACAHLPPGPQAAAGRTPVPMVTAATAMLGQPYRFGGEEPGGFDCSGLVHYAAHRAGIEVPRTAQELLRSGRPVARAELRAGDLVFMRLSGKELHVGIALGDGRFIHAPSSGGRVRIDSLGAAPYARGFLAARRLAVPES